MLVQLGGNLFRRKWKVVMSNSALTLGLVRLFCIRGSDILVKKPGLMSAVRSASIRAASASNHVAPLFFVAIGRYDNL